jgi:putative peptide zinc metalloprotease protein
VTPPLDPTASTTTPLGDVVRGGAPALPLAGDGLGRVDAAPRPPVPEPAAGVELFGETPGSGYREPPSLVRRSDGQTIQLTPLLYEVLRAVDGRRDHDEIAAVVGDRIGRTATATDVRFLIEAKLRPLGLLRNPDGSDPELKKANPLLALRCRFVITDPDLTRRITRPFAALFRPSLVLFFVAAFAWITWWTFFEQGLISGFHQALYEPHLLLLVFGLTLVSAGFHEFGHAAACRYGGATPGAMGFGLYLIWPAFYTDVTDSYRLGRAGRLRVDLGGLYFNAVFAVGTFAVWTWLRADALLLLIFAQVLQMSRQLAPLVRFDGYHILSDLIGVPDLFAHMKPTLLGLLPSRWRGGQHQALKPWARVAVTAWVLVVLPLLLVMLGTIVVILPRLAATVWDSLGIQWDVLGQNWADGAWADVGIRVLSIVSLALPVLTITYLLARVVRRAARWAWQAGRGSRARQAAAGFGAVALLGAVALAWWPQGQYVPIDDEERGTLPELFAFVGLPAPELVRATSTPTPPAGTEALVPPVTGPPTLPPGTAAGPPQLALVAVPAESSHPLTGSTSAPDVGAIVAVAPPTGDVPAAWQADDWPFPWGAAPPMSEGDNRAMVINTQDGSTVYDLAFAFVWVTDDEPVGHRNDAIAYASCKDCTSVAVAFQVILIVGQVDEIIPVNVAEAGNFDCESCTTHALAVQLVATLKELPDDDVMAQLGHAWAQLQLLEEHAQSLTFDQIYTWLKYTQMQILSILTEADLVLYGNVGSDATTAEDGGLEDPDGLDGERPPDEAEDAVPPAASGTDRPDDEELTAAEDEPAAAEETGSVSGHEPSARESEAESSSSTAPAETETSDDPEVIEPAPTNSTAPEDETGGPDPDEDGEPDTGDGDDAVASDD